MNPSRLGDPLPLEHVSDPTVIDVALRALIGPFALALAVGVVVVPDVVVGGSAPVAGAISVRPARSPTANRANVVALSFISPLPPH